MPNLQTSIEQLLLKVSENWDDELGKIRAPVALATTPDINPADAAGSIQGIDGLGERFVALINAVTNDQRKAGNVREAITAAGPRNALILATAAHFLHSLQKRSGFVHRAVLSGAWARLIGQEFGRRDVDFLFLAAVMQPIGIEVINLGAPEVYNEIDPYCEDTAAVCAIEERQLGTNHRDVGSDLLRKWGFPNSVCLAVERSNDFQANDVDFRNRGFCRTISFSTHIANTWLANPGRARVERLADQAHRYLGLQTGQFAELWAESLDFIPTINMALGLPAWPDQLVPDFALKAYGTLAGPAGSAVISDRRRDDQAASPESIAEVETVVTDQLTFERRLADELSMSIRYDWPMAVGLIKIEHSEAADWATSDTNIRSMHEAINSVLRVSDAAGSIGTSEIAILLPAAMPDESASVMRSIENEIVNRSRRDTEPGQHCVTFWTGLINRSADAQFSTCHEAIAAARDSLEIIGVRDEEKDDRPLSSIV